MVEKKLIFGKHTLNHICGRKGVSIDDLVNEIDTYIKEGLGKAEIYRRLTAHHGITKPHASNCVEDTIKKGILFTVVMVDDRMCQWI